MPKDLHQFFSQSDKKRRQRQKVVPLPVRLGWPAGTSNSQVQTKQATALQRNGTDRISNSVSFAPINPSIKSSLKRRRVDNGSKQLDVSAGNVSSNLWIDKYAPDNVTELCVAPKKVKEVQSWIQSYSNGQQSQCKLFILVGSPGIGKSSMVRVLAKELCLELREWNDSYYDSSIRKRDSFAAGGNNEDALMMVHQESPIHLFNEFLKQTGVGFQSLDFITTSDGKIKSGKRQKPRSGAASQGSLILIDELPNLHTAEAKMRFREIMNSHLRNSKVPTILVFSDTREGKHRPDDLEALIDPSYLYSPAVQIMQIQPVVKTRLTKVLNNIAKKERLSWSPHLLEKLHVQSGGDIRYAIMTLQFDNAAHAAASNSIHSQSNENENDRVQMYQRDVKLSAFHALGKALYAKRKPASSLPSSSSKILNKDQRPPLDFDPDEVLHNCDMELPSAITFLQSHSVDFFTDISELSEALDHFSTSAFLSEQHLGQRQYNSAFPDSYVASIAGRAVAATNRHPTATRFRQLSAPKIFEVIRNRRENESEYRNLHRRLLLGTGDMCLDNAVRATTTFVTDCLPYVRTIAPLSVNISMGKMHSFFLPRNRTWQQQLSSTHSARSSSDDQQQILELDDIVEDNSEDENHHNGFLPPGVRSPSKVEENPTTDKKPLPIPASPVSQPKAQPEVILIDDSD